MSFPSNLVPLGTANYDDLSVVVELTDTPTDGIALPSEASYAILTFIDQNVCVKYSADPTATTGGVFLAGTSLALAGCEDILKRARFIEAAAGAKLAIQYFRGATS